MDVSIFIVFCIEIPVREQMQGSVASKRSLHCLHIVPKTGPEVVKLFSSSTQLSMKFFLLKNVKMPTIP